tara:strand:- start:3003 stop:3848 length:846 start_codon:yes stop_codon:yes gene_type:complete
MKKKRKKMKINKNLLIVLVCSISLQACFNANSEGCIKGDCINGPGIFNYENGDSFNGNFKDGQIVNGTYTFNNGTKYIGTWNDGKLNGQCEMYINDGTKYIGEVLDGQFHRIGTYTFADGSKWTGTWNNGDRVEGNFNYDNVYSPQDIIGSDSLQILELIKGDANMHMIDIDFNGVKEKFIFDTGASDIFMTPSLLSKIKSSGAKVESLNIKNANAEIANGELIPIEYVRLSNVKIGNFIINNLIVSVSFNDNSSLLFGKGALNKFKNFSFSKDGSLTLVK